MCIINLELRKLDRRCLMDANYEGEMDVIVIADEEGHETYYEEEMQIPYDNKRFAILLSLPEEEETGHQDDEPDIIIARIEQEAGEDVYVAPTEEEFDAVAAIYTEAEE